jgi:hypothetical protein
MIENEMFIMMIKHLFLALGGFLFNDFGFSLGSGLWDKNRVDVWKNTTTGNGNTTEKFV